MATISLNDQIAAVSNAWVPFLFALLVVCVAVWRAFEWAYRATINKTKSNFELSCSQTELLTRNAAIKEENLNETVKKQATHIEILVAEIDNLKKQVDSKREISDDDIRAFRTSIESLSTSIERLSNTSSTAAVQVEELRQANNAVSEAVSHSTPWMPSIGARSGFGVGKLGSNYALGGFTLGEAVSLGRNPFGGSMLSSSERSRSAIARKASAVGLSRSCSGMVSSHWAYSS